MKTEPGIRVEPVLSEPAIASPVALDIDEDGRWWIVEDRGYPLNTDKVGRIKLLEDTNSDGVPDKSTLFADNLTLPTGIMRWKKGVLITDAPNLLYLEDTNGDGKADLRKPILSGFAFTNPQHMANSPTFGLDNWIYIAHENPTTAIIFADKFGDRGTEIHYAEKPGIKISEKGRNIRFKPDSMEIEALSGTSQFGYAFDEFGHQFVLNNTFHTRHEVVQARYLKRNPDLPLATAVEEISDHGTPAKVFPLVARQRIEMLTNVGEFTSACGMLFYLGGAFPDSFRNSTLVAEPAHNLVHRDSIQPAGATFSAKRTHESVEFIASADPWFRPVNFYTGPDGAIYMLDYYRLVIEHPEWMATWTHNSKDLAEGMDMGRIYRIVPEGKPIERVKQLKLSQASTAELVSYLGHANIWYRRTAQRLLMDRKPADAAPMVAKLLDAEAPATRVHALWTLDGLGKLENAAIEKALKDPVAGVRENALKLAEPRRLPAVMALIDDPDPRVRFQLLCTLGFYDGSGAARDKLLFTGIEDRWMQVAALSAGSAEARRIFASAASQKWPESKGRAQLFRQAASVIAARRQPAEVQATLAQIGGGAAWWQSAALEGMAQGWRGGAPAAMKAVAQGPLLALYGSTDPAVRRAALRVLEATGVDANVPQMAAAVKIAQDAKADAAVRGDAVGLLALGDAASRQDLFRTLVDPHQPEAVQMAACRALGRIPGPGTAEFLFRNWRAMTPAVRMEAADAIYRDPARHPMVLAALKSGDIQAWTLAFRHKRQLVMHKDPAIRDASRALFEAAAGDRAQVITKYQPALDSKADAGSGKQVFERVCKKCHMLNGNGAEVGPDLATVRNQPKQVLLTDILNPSQSISQGFEAFVVDTVNSGTLDGVLGPQTPTTITLRHEEGKQDVIQRKDIREMHVTNLSAMPGDLEKQVDVQQMADLLEYIKSVSR